MLNNSNLPMENQKTKRVSINNIYKSFKIGYRKDDGALAKILTLISGKEPQKILSVINGLSLDTWSGENVGIIGKNGSGKSTLLRLIAGIYQPDSGEIKTRGNLIYIDGYGAGLKKKLSMRDNIYLVGLLMGLSKKEIDKRFNDIVSFSELENFLDTKIYQFSSGMLNRLSFSITIYCLEHKKPDIILLDEVFGSGGDLFFQRKATKKMEEFISGGANVILVSHDLNIIKKYCHRVILLQKGKKIEEGNTEVIIEKYKTLAI